MKESAIRARVSRTAMEVSSAWLVRIPQSDTAIAVGMASLAFIALTIVNVPSLLSFTPMGDDYALILHSGRFFSPSLTDWVANGYGTYNVTFPELGRSSTNFVRPTLNAVVYLESWLSPSARSVVLLLPNYLAHAICVALVFLSGRRIFALSKLGSVLASGILLGSVALGPAPQRVAYGGDVIATLFALIALVVLHSYLTREPAMWKGAIVALSLLAALFAKESAAGTPVVLAFYALWASRSSIQSRHEPGRHTSIRRWGPVAAAILVPTILFATARLAAGLHGMYVTEELPNTIAGIPLILLNPFRFIGTTFFPIETTVLKQVVSGAVLTIPYLLGLMRGVLAVGLNLVGWLLVLRLLLRSTERSKVGLLLGMAMMASAAALVKAEPRFMYFSQALFVPLFVLALTELRTHARSSTALLARWLVPLMVTSALLVGPVYGMAQQTIAQGGFVSDNMTTARMQDAILTAMDNPRIRRVYLVNATQSMSPGLQALRFLSDIQGTQDIRLRVVNTFNGPIPADDGRGGVEFARHGDELIGRITAGSSQYLLRVPPDAAALLGQPGVIEYGSFGPFRKNALGNWQYSGDMSFTIPNASRADLAIVGVDPRSPGVFVLEPPTMRWTRFRP